MICIFKCICCGDQMKYSLEDKALKCSTCGSVCEIENYDMEYMTYEGKLAHSDDIEELGCPVCGARVTVQEGSAKMNCSFCGSELAAFAIHENEMAPEKIIPCKLSREEARIKLVNWWIEHETMPKLDEKELKMEFQDLYVPVWLFYADAVTHLKARICIFAFGSATVDRADANRYVGETTVKRGYESHFFHVPFDCSCHIEDERFSDIEPFDFSEMADFNSSYLSGHLAECYHFEPEQVLPRAVGRLKKFALEQSKELLDTSIGASEIVSMDYQEVDVTPTEVVYALVPMWICKYVYKGVRRNIYINGQTGKVNGDVLFASRKYKSNLIFYAVCAALFCMTCALVFVLYFSPLSHFLGSLNPAMWGFAVFPFMFMVPLSLLDNDTGTGAKDRFSRKLMWAGDKDRLARKRRRTGENIQLKHGMKMNARVSGVLLLLAAFVMALLLLPPGIMRLAAGCRTGRVDASQITSSIVVSMFLGLAFSAIMTLFFAQKLTRFETYFHKAEYQEYTIRHQTKEWETY